MDDQPKCSSDFGLEKRTSISKNRIAAFAGARERLIIPPRNSFGT